MTAELKDTRPSTRASRSYRATNDSVPLKVAHWSQNNRPTIKGAESKAAVSATESRGASSDHSRNNEQEERPPPPVQRAASDFDETHEQHVHGGAFPSLKSRKLAMSCRDDFF